MVWNWQQNDWPNFSWAKSRLQKAEEEFLLGLGVFVGTWKHLSPSEKDLLTVESICIEAITTSEIEGEILNRASVQSSIRRELGFQYDKVKAKPAEQGIAEMMVDLYRTFSKPLSKEMLTSWHKMIMKGRADLKDLGRYRKDVRPMQVISGPIHSLKVHFEAPPSKLVPKEMEKFINWFNRTAPNGPNTLPPITRAGLAHLYFESIHPFEDGNGRIGRAISEKVLLQYANLPALNALAATILLRKKNYYSALENANKENEVSDWLSWFAGVAIESQRRTINQIEFILDKTQFLEKFRGQLNERQEKVLLRMFREGPEGFEGGLSASNYAAITRASPATTTRDLSDLVKKGVLKRKGEKRHARYYLTMTLKPVLQVTLDKNGNFA